MKRWEVINKYIQEYRYRFYLEIGIRTGTCFHKVNCLHKTGVDPEPRTVEDKGETLIRRTSDRFFQEIGVNVPFDCVFIDGLHRKKQVIRDIENSLKVLSPNGTILLHDCNPQTEASQWEKNDKKANRHIWNGDVWKAFAHFRRDPDLEMFTINTDHGIGVIRRGEQEPYTGKADTWEDLVQNRQEILQLRELQSPYGLFFIK